MTELLLDEIIQMIEQGTFPRKDDKLLQEFLARKERVFEEKLEKEHEKEDYPEFIFQVFKDPKVAR
jgi:hypothetical protein